MESAGYGSLALRHVANLANLAWFGAQPADETDEIEDAREERELSVIMDSGDEADDAVEAAREGRRVGKWYASRPFLMIGLYWSTQLRANDELCACAIAEHIDGRLALNVIALAAGVFETAD